MPAFSWGQGTADLSLRCFGAPVEMTKGRVVVVLSKG
jgi:hypothetical protein